MAGWRPRRVVAWLVAVTIAALVGAAVVLYVILPRSGLTPVAHDWTAEWRADPPVVTTIPGGLLETAMMRMGWQLPNPPNWKSWRCLR